MLDFYLTNKHIFDILFNFLILGLVWYMYRTTDSFFKQLSKERDEHIEAMKREKALLEIISAVVEMDDPQKIRRFVTINMQGLFKKYEKIREEIESGTRA